MRDNTDDGDGDGNNGDDDLIVCRAVHCMNALNVWNALS